jgi:hypothetical protein
MEFPAAPNLAAPSPRSCDRELHLRKQLLARIERGDPARSSRQFCRVRHAESRTLGLRPPERQRINEIIARHKRKRHTRQDWDEIAAELLEAGCPPQMLPPSTCGLRKNRVASVELAAGTCSVIGASSSGT